MLNVTPGPSFTVSGDWSISEVNSSYCPDCIIQINLAGLSPLSGQDDLAQGVGFNDSGSYSQTFTAPTTPGTYYVGGVFTLQYGFIPVSGGADTKPAM